MRERAQSHVLKPLAMSCLDHSGVKVGSVDSDSHPGVDLIEPIKFNCGSVSILDFMEITLVVCSSSKSEVLDKLTLETIRVIVLCC